MRATRVSTATITDGVIGRVHDRQDTEHRGESHDRSSHLPGSGENRRASDPRDAVVRVHDCVTAVVDHRRCATDHQQRDSPEELHAVQPNMEIWTSAPCGSSGTAGWHIWEGGGMQFRNAKEGSSAILNCMRLTGVQVLTTGLVPLVRRDLSEGAVSEKWAPARNVGRLATYSSGTSFRSARCGLANALGIRSRHDPPAKRSELSRKCSLQPGSVRRHHRWCCATQDRCPSCPERAVQSLALVTGPAFRNATER